MLAVARKRTNPASQRKSRDRQRLLTRIKSKSGLLSGTKKSETTFADGIANFEKIWRGDGSKKIESGVIGDVAHGSHKRWHPNGQLHLSAEYHEGQWNGLVEDYDETGKLIHKATYKMGKLVEELLPKN